MTRIESARETRCPGAGDCEMMVALTLMGGGVMGTSNACSGRPGVEALRDTLAAAAVAEPGSMAGACSGSVALLM